MHEIRSIDTHRSPPPQPAAFRLPPAPRALAAARAAALAGLCLSLACVTVTLPPPEPCPAPQPASASSGSAVPEPPPQGDAGDTDGPAACRQVFAPRTAKNNGNSHWRVGNCCTRMDKNPPQNHVLQESPGYWLCGT